MLSRIQQHISRNAVQMENVHLEHILPNKYEDTWSDIIFLDSKKISEIDNINKEIKIIFTPSESLNKSNSDTYKNKNIKTNNSKIDFFMG